MDDAQLVDARDARVFFYHGIDNFLPSAQRSSTSDGIAEYSVVGRQYAFGSTEGWGRIRVFCLTGNNPKQTPILYPIPP